eukprot:Protomagalhaensia_sp_Gyna_25__581@NODE_1274_length_1991_cov_10_531762_g1016_i0_p1_GENE_NODE_1274_length_1991_cov_10_531762_g1016_i0NODE_1274_length_1991_cov_10_531762_g1016_i0_p1_ORF_typecomplete_len586_score97_95_NODE_1274_length_1991_cov_10_531762_g1016_i02341970
MWAAFLLIWRATAWAPAHPWLCNSVWPIVHQDSYSQGSTNQSGITLEDVLQNRVEVDRLFDRAVSGTLSIYWSCTPPGAEPSTIAWGSGVHAIFKVDTAASPMTIIDAVRKPKHLVETDVFRGIYSVISREGIFYSAIGNLILACTDDIPGIPSSDIKALGSFELDSAFFDPDEAIMSLNILYSGEIAFLTNKGKIGVVDRDLSKLLDLTTLAYHDIFLASNTAASRLLPHEELKVSNSMTVDQYGGLYVVSSKLMHRLYYDTETKALHSILPTRRLAPASAEIPFANGTKASGVSTRVVWATPYSTEITPLPDRLSKEGSGTSPTLLEFNGELFVTICDGLYRQNILVFRALTGDLVASAPVDFGQPRSLEESYTEQSILVHGHEMIVVQNALTAVGKRLNQVVDTWDPEIVLELGNAPVRFANHTSLAPVVVGDSPRGVQKFQLLKNPDESQQGYSLVSAWATTEFGCPNSIPTLSTTTSLIYCVGKGRLRPTFKLVRKSPAHGTSPAAIPYPDGFEGGWVISAIDWITGAKVFDLRTGSDIRYNSLYAAVQIGPRNEVIYGSMGGLVRARKIFQE